MPPSVTHFVEELRILNFALPQNRPVGFPETKCSWQRAISGQSLRENWPAATLRNNNKLREKIRRVTRTEKKCLGESKTLGFGRESSRKCADSAMKSYRE